MRREPPTRAGHLAPILYPAAMLVAFFVLPFGTMLAVSFFERDPAAFYVPGFTLESYARFLTPFFGGILGFSVGLAAAVAALCVVAGFPFTWALVRLSRRAQAAWLVALLSVLSLSEVIIGFAFSTLLSRTAGVSNLLVAVGLMDAPEAWLPGLGAVLVALFYQAFPYAVLVLYPALARLDPGIVEAAATLGASPARAFLGVVVPGSRGAIVATAIMTFVFALGSYLLPQILGRPRHWTLSVMITDQAIYQSNMPFAAAMAVFLVGVSLSLVALVALLGRRGDAP